MNWYLRHTGNNLEIVGKTYVEFARIKEQLFDKWCSSKKDGHDFKQIRQLLLTEEFKWGLSNEIKTYLSEQKVDTLDNAA